ncbi:hypothetical protein M438DRAFT_98838 [Aureobasidium pullulans EXF-150]|uniref:Uncharacterized protein n=1 Tax=Aureobasidium pullulans EXF-150 TaxID=1043002 RepID=A0A074X6S3_AURPU|nr:uncharacterized protein M438DRAFT_98838 [Aureobasidium pullulans EXF-150]KEQ81190.1 hypothetical protein M438DRAFT_98838 [Aureobasidium pullulans EXF-150]
MVPTKAQKTVKSTETDDDGGITFKKKQDDLRKSVVIRQEKARTRIRKNRSNKQKDLQKRIESLKRNITVEQYVEFCDPNEYEPRPMHVGMHIQHGNPRNASQPSISTFRQFLPPCAACSPHASETWKSKKAKLCNLDPAPTPTRQVRPHSALFAICSLARPTSKNASQKASRAWKGPCTRLLASSKLFSRLAPSFLRRQQQQQQQRLLQAQVRPP